MNEKEDILEAIDIVREDIDNLFMSPSKTKEIALLAQLYEIMRMLSQWQENYEPKTSTGSSSITNFKKEVE